MRYFIAFAFLFLTNFFVPTMISAATNPTNRVVHARMTTPKKLRYKERVILNFQKYKSKFKAKLSDVALTFVITGAILLLLGVVILAKGNKKSNNSTPQGGVGNESAALAAVLGVVMVVASILCFLIALLDSI
jgi:hypothetical protein